MPGARSLRKQGEGERPCQGLSREQGTPCGNNEIEGLEFCLLHMPDEYLEEAEEITGLRRCRHGFPGDDSCRQYAYEGSEPPSCTAHGSYPGSMSRALATRRGYENRLAKHLTELLAEGGEKLLAPDPIGDPLSELLDLAAELGAAKEMLRGAAAKLYADDKIRYIHSKAGEQLRMEITLYERALERFAKILIDISKLKIEDRLAGVREATAAMLERALDAALEDSGIGLEGKDKARESFRKHLKVVA
jgi:hypothetical protein